MTAIWKHIDRVTASEGSAPTHLHLTVFKSVIGLKYDALHGVVVSIRTSNRWLAKTYLEYHTDATVWSQKHGWLYICSLLYDKYHVIS